MPVGPPQNGIDGFTLAVAAGDSWISARSVYAHLSGFNQGVRQGRRVVQGDVVGFVGSTGLATGPHLHYEFHVNGVHQNPMRLAMPPGPAITAQLRSTFDETAQPLFARLDMLRNTDLARLD